jgi:hypothetical protein
MDETADIELGQPSAIHHIFDAQPAGRLIVFGGFGQNSVQPWHRRVWFALEVTVRCGVALPRHRPKLVRDGQPFLVGGAGILLFSPTNYDGTADSSVNAASPFYGGSSTGATPAYGGSSIGLPRQAKPMFLYGAGADLPMSSRLYFRVEFRALGSKTPDFGETAFQTGSFSFTYVPSAGVAYRF